MVQPPRCRSGEKGKQQPCRHPSTNTGGYPSFHASPGARQRRRHRQPRQFRRSIWAERSGKTARNHLLCASAQMRLPGSESPQVPGHHAEARRQPRAVRDAIQIPLFVTEHQPQIVHVRRVFRAVPERPMRSQTRVIPCPDLGRRAGPLPLSGKLDAQGNRYRLR